MNKFLQGSGAIVIGLIIASLFTFPVLTLGAVAGWFFIQESLEPDEEEKD